jgi:hypothetical protein
MICAYGVPAAEPHSGRIYIPHRIGFICSVLNQDLNCPGSHITYRFAWRPPDSCQGATIGSRKITLLRLYLVVYGGTNSLIREACFWDAVYVYHIRAISRQNARSERTLSWKTSRHWHSNCTFNHIETGLMGSAARLLPVVIRPNCRLPIV